MDVKLGRCIRQRLKSEDGRWRSLVVCVSLLSMCRVSDSFSQRVAFPAIPIFSERTTSVGLSLPMVLQDAVDDGIAGGGRKELVTSPSQLDGVMGQVMSYLKANDYESAKKIIEGMVQFLQEDCERNAENRSELLEVIDSAFQAYSNSAFAPPFGGKQAPLRISLGMELIKLQLSSNALDSPYNTIPRRTLKNALKAVTAVNKARMKDSFDMGLTNTDAAYRLLQRLVTGNGIRKATTATPIPLYETDFNAVLNAYSNDGRMEMAHRVVALQERTPHAPALSLVAYSILLKGYGKLGDLANVEMLLAHCGRKEAEPDVVMLNSLIDAYVNCNALDRAQEVFEFMRNPKTTLKFKEGQEAFFASSDCPRPNKRTYNIMLKGLATQGLLEEALVLSDEMQRNRLWDHITTNTLVQAAVKAGDFQVVEQVLEDYTESADNLNNGRHPNAEAYTTAIDGYAKAGELQEALALLNSMKKRGVEPNEFTYTCLIGALARNKRILQAQKMMNFMEKSGLEVRTVTYNSFISGMVQRELHTDGALYDNYVDKSILLLHQMLRKGIRPNAVTISVIIEAFGKCDNPRLAEAVALIEKLEADGIIAVNTNRISTALIRTFGAANDLEGAMRTFKRTRRPDLATVNAFLDTCVRCGNERAARRTFENFFHGTSKRLRPDVITFSVLITSELVKSSPEGYRNARSLYEEMKFQKRIMPDHALIDIILKGLIQNGQRGQLEPGDIRFVASVLRDAEKLNWGEGQLERRKQATQTVMTGRMARTWNEEAGLFGLLDEKSYEDEVFRRHGWNKVDSGFRLWGSQISSRRSPTNQNDELFQSKGWNNVDSGFRII